jgi:uncharacterized membrane protein
MFRKSLKIVMTALMAIIITSTIVFRVIPSYKIPPCVFEKLLLRNRKKVNRQ